MKLLRWYEFDEFPNYSISEAGDIVNIKMRKPRSVSVNQHGILKVSLYNKDGERVTKSVAKLVADAFLPAHESLIFDTPIHLDGDILNCHVDNLAWRPRWFAVKYHKQFKIPEFHVARGHFIDRATEDPYDSVKDICISNGLHYQEVIRSITEGTKIFPTDQIFDIKEE